MTNLTDEAQALREELGRILKQLPQPQAASHPHHLEIEAFCVDVGVALDAVDMHPEALSIVESILASDAEASFEPSAATELAAAWERLARFPVPNDAEHPFLNNIFPAVQGLQLLLAALSRVDTARRCFDRLRALRAAQS
jgi:hypothetical protein